WRAGGVTGAAPPGPGRSSRRSDEPMTESSTGARDASCLLPRSLLQQVGEQVEELGLADLLGEVGGHRRERADLALLDRRLRHAHLLALGVGEDDDLALLAQDQAADDLAAV